MGTTRVIFGRQPTLNCAELDTVVIILYAEGLWCVLCTDSRVTVQRATTGDNRVCQVPAGKSRDTTIGKHPYRISSNYGGFVPFIFHTVNRDS